MTTTRILGLILALLAASALAADKVPTPAGDAARFPLALVDDGQRAYLVDRNQTPFLLTCEIAQAMLNRLKIEDVRHYLDLRKSHGYNAVWFIIATPNAWIDDTASSVVKVGPRNAYGVLPFDNTTGDLSSPNRAYFHYVRDIVDEAAARGMLVGIAPAYVGHAGDDLLPLMKKSGPEGCRAYGEFVGALLRERPNVFWIHHGDANPYNYGGAATTALVDAFVQGLRSADDKYPRFHTAISREIRSAGVAASHRIRTSSYRAQFDASGRMVNPMPWLNLNHVYVKNRGQYGVMLADMLEAWDVYRTKTTPRLPYVVLDGVCDHYGDDARANRAQGYYALLSGAVGFFTGNIRICWFMSPDSKPPSVRNWRDEIVSDDDLSATHTAKLFRSLPWWKLIPDTSRRLLQSGDEWCAAARTTDQRLAVLYLPTRRTISVNLEELKGERINASWFNPRTGEAQAIGRLGRAAREFTPPADTNDREQDWVLLLKAHDQ